MRKISFSIMGMVMGLALFTGCSKEETASPVSVDLTKTATVKVYAYAESDLTNSKTERAPAGTKFTVMVRYSDLSITDYPDGYWTKEVVTDAQGTFTVEVPTVDDGVYVYVVGNAYEGSIKQTGDAAAKNAKYYSNENSTYVYPNDEEAMNFYFDYDYIGNN
jgi:hypothetical protein